MISMSCLGWCLDERDENPTISLNGKEDNMTLDVYVVTSNYTALPIYYSDHWEMLDVQRVIDIVATINFSILKGILPTLDEIIMLVSSLNDKYFTH